MNVNPHSHLAECVAENFRVYADWRLKNFSVTKQSTIWVEWKFLRLLFKRQTGRKVDELVGEQISEVSFQEERLKSQRSNCITTSSSYWAR